MLVGWCFGGGFGFGVVARRPPSPVGSKEGTGEGGGGHQAPSKFTISHLSITFTLSHEKALLPFFGYR